MMGFRILSIIGPQLLDLHVGTISLYKTVKVKLYSSVINAILLRWKCIII